ncbi:MAG: cobalt transporter CbiM [Jaaginema sp. PMC 1079.18]|nr:cobalt transporter CbiM [Jaaginema sp. PMC 1080.18]MEC4851418.1 cobalt transporter CbiM [Jaaginema sp. PMC 1079.18]MEC4866196.1 cobalt transporter CbiM [Jaaginema sp. PMC 1078.18]
MHIPDGLLPSGVYISGYAITGGVTWYALRQIGKDGNSQAQIPKASLLTAAFFVSSLIHIPIPPTSIHFVLNGLMGIVLGFYAFPAIVIGLFFQAVMFGHGGMAALGINAAMMGIPALLASYIFRFTRPLEGKNGVWKAILVFVVGSGAIALSASIFTLITLATITEDMNINAERTITILALGGYGIQALLEGIFTVMIVSFLQKVKPELLKE